MTIYKGAREAATKILYPNDVENFDKNFGPQTAGPILRDAAARKISDLLAPLVEAAQNDLKMKSRKLPTPFGHNCAWCYECCDRVEKELREALEKII